MVLGSDFVTNAAFHDELAPHYDAHLTSNPHNTLARQAFVDLVARHVSPGSTLLDLGCGTGIDALEYAQKGYRVLAYDNSPGMLAQLEQRCKDQIAAGKITAWSEAYPEFLEHLLQRPAPSAVVADFAVLNSIRELGPLFDTLARHLTPPGWVIASILNPFHWVRLRTPRWLLKAMREGDGSPVYTSQPYVTYIHFIPALLRAARQFQLVGRANAGRFVRYDSAMPGGQPRQWWGQVDSRRKVADRALWGTPAHRMLGHFVFVVLRRDP